MVVNWIKSALLSLNSCISPISNIKNPCVSVKTRHFIFQYLNMSLQDLNDVTTQYLLRTKCQYLASIQNDIQMQHIHIKIWDFNIKIGVTIIYTLHTCVKFFANNFTQRILKCYSLLFPRLQRPATTST